MWVGLRGVGLLVMSLITLHSAWLFYRQQTGALTHREFIIL